MSVLKYSMVVLVVLATGGVAWLFSPEDIAVSRDDSSLVVDSKKNDLYSNRLTDSERVSGGLISGSEETPRLETLTPLSHARVERVDPDVQLAELEHHRVIQPSDSAGQGEFIDPDDESFQYNLMRSEAIGTWIDPDDETLQRTITVPGRVGEFIDPDDLSVEREITNPGHLGERVAIE
ncbi:hypothetical protein DN062_02885 [Nitrincola tibetensis]|uniref:Uncharacterized protein n=1 Tax=Nitrincola tibetensis TaxID=2219697 RepID=A0A364NQE0_9GAMM|nr:hypothetical protein [Nitrincola tibetensis]RAU19230.1 hypothetical protein DN062_02885 [Nitrincola tibetensis]